MKVVFLTGAAIAVSLILFGMQMTGTLLFVACLVLLIAWWGVCGSNLKPNEHPAPRTDGDIHG